MITIKEIAELAGVSRGTVDRVLNRRNGVRPDVADTIRNIAKQYDYKPNRIARALVKRKRRCSIGMVSATTENIFFRDVLAGIRQAAKEVREFGINLQYREVSKFSVTDQLRCIDELLEQSIDALAINPINLPEVKHKLRMVTQQGIPIITFNSDIEDIDRIAYIGCDYKKTGKIAAGLIHLNNTEETNIGIVTGTLQSLGHSLSIAGFHEEIRNYPQSRIVETIETYDDEETAYQKIRAFLRKEKKVNAFFFSAGGKDGGLRAIRENCEKDKTRIITVDIDPFTRECLENGTIAATVCQQPFIQGYEPINQLANYLLYNESPQTTLQYTQAEIIIRQSL